MNQKQLDHLHQERERALEMGGKGAIDKQHAAGKLTARERIQLLVDPGSFFEMGLLADHSPENTELKDRYTACDGVITGTGLVEGRVIAIIAYDFTVLAGSMGSVGERKAERMRKLAFEERVPLVWLLDSAGARIQEMAGAHFAGTGSLFHEQVELSGVVPQVAAVLGPTAAGTSYIAALADYTPMVSKTGSMALAGPPLVKAAIGEEITTEELGGSQVHCKVSGCGDAEFPDDTSCILSIRKYLGFFPSHCNEKPPVKLSTKGLSLQTDPAIFSLLPEDRRKAYDMRKVIHHVVDSGDFFEIKPDFAKNIVVGFGRVMGQPIGIVANQPSHTGGAIDNDAADKAARFMMTCDAFQIPLLFLHDCPGFLVGSRVEKMGIIRHGAKMLHVVGSLKVPKISIVIRKSYGAGYYVMCGRGLKPDLIVGWPTAEISLMGAEGAVNIIMKNKKDEDEKAAKLNQYQANIGGFLSAKQAYVDDIIDPTETRLVIYRGLQLTFKKRKRRLPRKHGVMPV